METTTKRGFLLARGWIQTVILVFLFGFFVLGFLAYRTYTGEPPIPGRVVDPDGRLLFTRANIMAGSSSADYSLQLRCSDRNCRQHFFLRDGD